MGEINGPGDCGELVRREGNFSQALLNIDCL